MFTTKADIENMVRESEELLKRFNNLAYLDGGEGKVINFNMFSKDIMNMNMNFNQNEEGSPNPNDKNDYKNAIRNY